ncbi:hypothetical protein RI129_010723 [Pyrocoelia pectoralis]|uniref:Uncharacterized protein n=1 Tax=Pyrocoelia pectoralis TaxID=417401 RepID=A0AAN7V2H8_9COLE
MRHVLAFTIIIIACASKELPSFIKKCKLSGDQKIGDCIKDRIYELKPRLMDGIPELNLPPIEPLQLPLFELNTGNPNSNVAFNAKVSDLDVEGLKDVEIEQLDLNTENKTFEIKIKLPSVSGVGKYEVKGKVLLFQLQSKGTFTADLRNVESYTKIPIEIVSRDGKKYVSFSNDHSEQWSTFGTAKLHFENLFANKDINDQVNAVINENIVELASDVTPLIHTAVHKMITEILAPIFNDYSIDELFDD